MGTHTYADAHTVYDNSHLQLALYNSALPQHGTRMLLLLDMSICSTAHPVMWAQECVDLILLMSTLHSCLVAA